VYDRVHMTNAILLLEELGEYERLHFEALQDNG
jgi:hypothetical protein